jgi:hypothetical protein
MGTAAPVLDPPVTRPAEVPPPPRFPWEVCHLTHEVDGLTTTLCGDRGPGLPVTFDDGEQRCPICRFLRCRRCRALALEGVGAG